MTLSVPTPARALLVLVASFAALQWSAADASAATGSISGTVTDGQGHALGDVCVSAYSYNGGSGAFSANGRTTASGVYTLAALPDRSYTVSFKNCPESSRNDLDATYGVTDGHPDPVPVVVSGGASITGIGIALVPATSISGHVYGGAGTGTPASGICVYGGGQDAVTDGSGAYVLKHLRPGGGYTVSLSACDDATPYLPRAVGGDDNGNGATKFTPTLEAPVTGADEHLTLGGTIIGTVADADGHAITTKDVCVSASGVQGNTNYRSGRSTADGAFAIRGLRAGKYQVYYRDCAESDRNDLPDYFGGSANPTEINVQLGATHGAVALSLAEGTTISGRVYGGAGTGAPLKDACVSAWSTGTASSSYADTAADGSYTLKHVVPGGGYRLSFSPCTSPTPWVQEYYDNKPTEEEADVVVATASGTSGIDAHLSRGASISGTVVDADGHAITTRDICVAAQTSSGAGYGWATSDASGAFAITGLPAGSYTLRFEDCGGERNDTELVYEENGSTTIPLVLGQAKDGLIAKMPPGTSISGHVYGGTGAATPLQDACVNVVRASAPTSSIASTSSDASGAYSVKRLTPGVPYLVRFRPCSSGTVYTQVWYDGQTNAATANAVTPTAGNPSVDVDGHLPTGASISGTVTDAAGHAITTKDICVSATPVAYSSDADSGSATTDANGKYSIPGLVSGSYHVFFRDCGNSARNDVSQYYGGAPDVGASTIVVLSAGGAKTGIDAKLAAGTTVSGIIYAGPGSGTPLGRACVDIETVPFGQSTYGYADDEGRYDVSHLPVTASGYRVKAYDCGSRDYMTRYYGGDFRRSSGTVLHPTATQPASGIDMHLVTGATIAGTVRDAGGVVTSGVCVYAQRYGSATDDYYSAYGNVDGSGHYRVNGLPGGNYTVYAYDCGNERNDLEQYVDAPPVPDGATVDGVDVTMRPAAAISGHVYGGAGAAHPLDDVCVIAYSSYGGDYPIFGEYPSYYWEARVWTDSEGRYTVKHLMPGGSYKISFNECFDDGGLAYGSQFFDRVSDLSQAATLRPTAAEPATGVDAHLPAADAAPDTTITGGPAANAATNQTAARFSFISDQAGATFECAVDGKAYAACSSPYTMGGLTTGSHSFSVRARRDGKVDPSPPVVSWTVNPASSTSTSQGVLTAGGTFSSDAGAAPSAAVPVVADVTLPAAGQVTLTKEPATTPSANGYTVFGQQVDIAATAADGSGPVSGTTAKPIALAFKIDGAQIPAGTDRGAVTVLRNGVPAPACTTSDGSATPDPCVSNRRELASGALEIDVLTTHCSTWNFAASPTVAPAPVNASAPTISGAPAVGGTLTADAGSWTGSGVTYAYQWLRDGEPVPGATAHTYVVTVADQGHRLAVRVTATNASGQASTTSTALEIPAAPTPGNGTPGNGDKDATPGNGGSTALPPVLTGKGDRPPTLTIAPFGKVRLASVARTGLPLRLSCSRACRAEVKLTVPAAVAKRLKLTRGKAAVVIGSARADLSAKPKVVTVRLSAKAVKALRRARSAIQATLVVRVGDASGTATTSRAVTLRR